MILWCDGAYDARENMRRDAALLDLAGALETVLGWRARRADGAAAMPLTV